MALAAGQEVEAFGLVGRFGAAVAGPDEPGRGFGRPVGLEGRHGRVQQEIVGCGHACGTAGATEEVGCRERKRERRWEEGEDGEEKKKRLHCGVLMLGGWVEFEFACFNVRNQENLKIYKSAEGVLNLVAQVWNRRY